MAASLEIALAVIEDVDRLVALDSIAQHDNGRAKAIERWVQDGTCYIARLSERILGYGVLHHQFFGFGFIDMLMVDASMRGTGVGRALVRHLETECKTDKLWSSTNQSNTIMQSLLISEGFERSGIIENLEVGDPELIFCKNMAASQ